MKIVDLVEINDPLLLAKKLEKKKVLGIDESGVGDYFSPLTAAVAIVKEENFARLEALGIKDSKKLSDSKIRKLAQIIKEEDLAKYQTAFISPKGYNRLAKYGNNANHIKMFVHLKAFTDSQVNTKKNKPIQAKDFDLVLIDQYSTLKAIESYFFHFFGKKDKKGRTNWAKFRRFGTEVILTQKAESKHLSVAVASVLARDLLLQKMDEYNADYDTTFPLGASLEVQKFAQEFIRERASDPETGEPDPKAEKILKAIIIKNFALANKETKTKESKN